MHGFTLESADSVRFGPEYGAAEQERNRHVLLGQALCGLLMGETLWTNAVFAFDSQGMVEVLGALSKAHLNYLKNHPHAGFPFHSLMMAVYPGDKNTFQQGMPFQNWNNPGEIFLRCYANRLCPNSGFQLSATPALDQDTNRRHHLAQAVRAVAGTSGQPVFGNNLQPEEEPHFENILAINEFIMNQLGLHAQKSWAEYAKEHEEFIIKPLNQGRKIKDMICFLVDALAIKKAAPDDWEQIGGKCMNDLKDAWEVLHDVLLECGTNIPNRSQFREILRKRGLASQDASFRILIELVDGHYLRAQYSNITEADREETSPASSSAESQIGEKWAAAVMKQASPIEDRKWSLINKFSAYVPSQDNIPTQPLNIQQIAESFIQAIYENKYRELVDDYHNQLQVVRNGGNQSRALQDAAKECTNWINRQMGLKNVGIQFRFNANDPNSGQGSLTLTYSGGTVISQRTGERIDAVAGIQNVQEMDEGSTRVIP